MVGLGIAPGTLIAEHGVEEDEAFAGDGGEGELGRFPPGAEPLVELAEHGIPAGRDQRGHVEHGADRGAAAPAVPGAAMGAAGTGVRRHADQRGYLAALELAELRQQTQQRRGEGRPDDDIGAVMIRRRYSVLPAVVTMVVPAAAW